MGCFPSWGVTVCLINNFIDSHAYSLEKGKKRTSPAASLPPDTPIQLLVRKEEKYNESIVSLHEKSDKPNSGKKKKVWQPPFMEDQSQEKKKA